ncbi:hypothetical protein KL86CLO1_10083 [uncultured Eubacteriales bacterium]|uniref:Uncharacterized protein n=1 Tax=uncultured Eubacteriales bacterium TaxID=172733 RepID=A0A212IW79_9FIRM|nr:hypothetical protein KL86CLO1_10083 [uncultured Eubacteriales bacterium]
MKGKNCFFLFLFLGDQESPELAMRAEFAQLRQHYLVGRSKQTGRVIGTTRSGYPKYESVYCEGVLTDLGVLDSEDWEHRSRALIEKYREWDMYRRLLEYTGSCAWLRRDKERERYALGLHMSRIFENPEWVGYEEFHAQKNGLGDDLVIEKAIEKINAEMQRNAGNIHMDVVSRYIIARCADETAATMVAEDGKSLGGAMDAIWEVAKEGMVNKKAVLGADPAFDAVDGYFGFNRADDIRYAVLAAVSGDVPVTPPAHSSARVVLDLADFL